MHRAKSGTLYLVSILVVVDDGRGRLARVPVPDGDRVSILVVVDDGRGHRLRPDRQDIMGRFNPCCCG